MDSKTINKYLERTGFREFNPKAVLFDMDGVLINSMPNHAIAWQRSMASFGINMSKEDAYATEGARGVDTIRKMVKIQQGRDIDEEESQRMYDDFHICLLGKIINHDISIVRHIIFVQIKFTRTSVYFLWIFREWFHFD